MESIRGFKLNFFFYCYDNTRPSIGFGFPPETVRNLLAGGASLLEGTTRGSLLLLGKILLGTVENLEELVNAVSHTSVEVGLGALDVVVQVVSELDNHIDSSLASRGLEVTIEEDCGQQRRR